MRPKICICVLVGLPASGKTTFVHKLRDHFEGTNIINYHICYDNILNSYSENQVQEPLWKSRRQEIVTFVEQIVCHIQNCAVEKLESSETYEPCKSGMTNINKEHQCKINVVCDINHAFDYQFRVDQVMLNFSKHFNISDESKVKKMNCDNASQLKHLIIIDDNMYYKSMRYMYYKIARKYELSFCILFFDVDINQCVKNNTNRNESYLNGNSSISKISNSQGSTTVTNEIIKNMSKKLEAPTNDGFENNKFSTIYFDESSNFDKAKKFIEESFNNTISVPCNIKASVQCLDESFLQTCDLALRKVVSSHIKKYMEMNSLETKPLKKYSTLDFSKTNNTPLKEFSRRMASIKKMVMKDIQNGNLQLELSLSADQLQLMRILNEAVEFYM